MLCTQAVGQLFDGLEGRGGEGRGGEGGGEGEGRGRGGAREEVMVTYSTELPTDLLVYSRMLGQTTN